MKAQKVKKENTEQIANYRAIAIKTALLHKGLRVKDVAKMLDKTDGAISRFINGQRTSRNFNAWVKEYLGIAV